MTEKIFRHALIIMSLLVIVSCSLSCREKTPPPPPVDIDQVDDDGSSRDKHIFREEIRRESEDARKKLQNEFRDR